MKYVETYVDHVPSCCGALVVNEFNQDVGKPWDDDADWNDESDTLSGKGRTISAAWKDALSKLKPGFTYQFWFVSNKRHDDTLEKNFEAHQLRSVIMALPKATKLASYINPNSKNLIEGWIVDNTDGKAFQ